MSVNETGSGRGKANVDAKALEQGLRESEQKAKDADKK